MLPLYITYMGTEGYGLVGFFSMLQASFVLLDLGLSPTISRETARFKSGATSLLNYLQLYRALSLIFILIAIVGALLIFFTAPLIVTKWLTLESLQVNEVVLCIQIMGIAVALRWMCGLVRGVIIGSERLVWLSGYNVSIATLRFVIVLPVMFVFGFEPAVFFTYQLLIAVLEFVGLYAKSQNLTPNTLDRSVKIGWSFKPVKSVLAFSLSIAFTSSIWVLVTQTDKVILSGILSLAEYGYFSLAVLVASGVLVVSGPVSNAIMPRLAKLHASNKENELLTVYRNATQLVTVIAGSISIAVAFLAEPLLYLWTNDITLTKKAAPILTLYVLGNGILAISAFPYYLQYALGKLKYHVIGNGLLVVLLIPSIIWAATHYGAIGAGYVWLIMNSVYFFVWVTFVHRKLIPNVYMNWLIQDVIKILLPTILLTWGVVSFLPTVSLSSRFFAFSYIIGISVVALAVAIIFSSAAINLLKKRLAS